MTKQERWQIYDSGAITQMTAIELLDWAGYWATEGVDSITDALQREQTKRAIRMILEDLGYCNKIVVGLAVSDEAFVAATIEQVDENLIHQIVVGIMARKLAWITDIDSVQD